MGIIADIHKDLDRGALQLLVEYRRRLYGEAVKLCGDKAQAEDLAFRTLERVLDRADTYKEDINLFAWMKSIMENIHKDDLKRPVPRGTMAIESGELERCAGADWSTDEQILKNSDGEVVREALRHIDPEFKQLLLMRYYDEFSLKEIAGILNKPIGTVGRRIQIAHRLLAGKLGTKLGKKPLAVLLAALLGIGTLFGAWVSPLGDWVAEKVFGNAPAETAARMDEAPSIIDPISGTGEDPVEPDNPVAKPQTNDNVISATTKQEGEDKVNISAKIRKTVATAAVAAMGFAARADLPPSYVQCEYIESTGLEYIKTGVPATVNTRFILDYQMLADYAPNSTEVPAMGINTPSGQFGIGAGPLNGAFVVRARARADWSAYTLVEGVSGYERNTVELRGNGTILVNENEIAEKQPGLNMTSSCDGGMYLFAVNESTSTRFRCVARVWGCKIYDGEKLLRDFVPCYNESSGVFGLYDMVGNEFYGKASGAGSFKGPFNPETSEVDYDLPPRYVRCDYIESTGSEYIKTDVSATVNTRFILDYQMLADYAPNSTEVPAMGINTSSGQFGIGAGPLNGAFVVRARACTGWGGYTLVEGVSGYERNTVELGGAGMILVNGNVIAESQTGLKSDVTLTGGMYLFALHENPDLVRFRCVARVWGCKLYNDTVLVRDFVPCFDLVSGTYGLYDAVGKKFYGNASGEGAFHGNANIDFEYEARALKNGDWKMFKYESRLTFKKMQPGKTLSNVPVLVRISESAIDGFKYEDCVGGCLAFASSPNGEWLDYEIEKWDDEGESLIWVRVPELTQKTRIRMYWGAKDGHCLVPVVSSASVWGKSGYSTVLHMNALEGTDATGGNEFTSKGTGEGVGPVGECLLKTSTSDGVNVSRAGNKAPWAKALTSKSFTMSFWVYFTTGGSAYPYMAQWGATNAQDADGFWLGASQDTTAGSYGTAFWFTAHSQIGAVFKTLKPELDWETLNYNNQWVHYTYSYEQLEDGRAHVRVFLNGTQVNEVTQALPDGATSYITAASNDLRLLGGYYSPSDKIRMDEFRLSPVARDVDYVSTAYRTMAESDFVTMSAAKAATSPAQGLVVFFF